MNPETEAILKAMGFVASDSETDDSSVLYCVPSTEVHIYVYPSFTPVSLRHALLAAGGEAKKKEIAKARETYLAVFA